MDSFWFVLILVLIVPLFPAIVIYKVLPKQVGTAQLSGPFKGFALKMTGAFAAYLVLVGVAIWLYNNKLDKVNQALREDLAQKDQRISQLEAENKAMGDPVIDWQITGVVKPSLFEGTMFFYDDGTTRPSPTGQFSLVKRSIAKEGKAAEPPNWMCAYNKNKGFQVINLNRQTGAADQARYDIQVDEDKREIRIGKTIEINSIANDSTVAVANFVEANPELKAKALQIDPNLINKASRIKKNKNLFFQAQPGAQ